MLKLWMKMLSVSSTSFLDRPKIQNFKARSGEAEQHSFRCLPQIRDRIDEAFYAKLADRTDSFTVSGQVDSRLLLNTS
jgi:hypothetical protein